MSQTEILVPLLNTNEPETRLAALHVKDGVRVEKGTLLFTLETTKVTSEVESPQEGYIRILVKEGDVMQVGDRMAVITKSENEPLDPTYLKYSQASKSKPNTMSSPGLRITKPAKLLAESLGMDLSTLPTDKLITEDLVRSHAGEKSLKISIPKSDLPQLVIFGGGGHAKTLIDMIRTLGTFSIAGIVDDGLPVGKKVLDVPVLGSRGILPALFEKSVKLAVNAVGGINDIGARVKVFEILESIGFGLPTLVHPRATLEPSAKIGAGVQVFANSYIGSDANLHTKCMVNTSAIVSHDCEIGAYTHIAPGAILAGHVHVGERTLVGMGASTNIGVVIGSDVRIGNLANLLADVPDKMIIQAGRFWVGKTRTE